MPQQDFETAQTPYLVRALGQRPLPALRGHAARLRPRSQRQALLSVEPVYQLLPHSPALADQKNADLSIPIPDSGFSQLPNPEPQFRPWSLSALLSVCPDRHHHHPARPPFAHPVPAAQVAHHRWRRKGFTSFFVVRPGAWLGPGVAPLPPSLAARSIPGVTATAAPGRPPDPRIASSSDRTSARKCPYGGSAPPPAIPSLPASRRP